MVSRCGCSTRGDDISPQNPHNPSLPTFARDPRTLLGGLDVDEKLREHIIGWMDDRGVRDPFAYLAAIIGRPEHDEHGIRAFLGERRRELAALDDDPRPPPKPAWCGECDEQTRLVEVDDGRTVARCIRCHPLSVARPGAPPRSEAPDAGEYPF